jgi:ATP-dependent exoDNAse (exonuclease V) beta subunit
LSVDIVAQNTYSQSGSQEPQKSGALLSIKTHVDKLEKHYSTLSSAKSRSLITIPQIEKRRDAIDKVRADLDQLKRDASMKEYRDLISDLVKDIRIACDQLSLAAENCDENRPACYAYLREATEYLEKVIETFYRCENPS